MIALALTMLLAAEPHPLRLDVAFMTTGAVADLAATEYALKHCQSCREGNPMGPQLPARIGLKMATLTVGTLVCRRLRKDGHPKLARAVGFLGLVGWGTVAAVNMVKAR